MSFDKNKIEELYPGALMYETMLINKGNETVLKKACEVMNILDNLKKMVIGINMKNILPELIYFQEALVEQQDYSQKRVIMYHIS